MMPPNETTVLSMGQRILPTAVRPPSSTKFHGFIDCVAVTVDRSVAGEIVVWLARSSLAPDNFPVDIFLSWSIIETPKLVRPSGLVVVTEASFSMTLQESIPQAVGAMYAYAQALR